MSVQAGILFADRRPILPSVLDRLKACHEPHTRGRASHAAFDGVALLSCVRAFDRLSSRERQPVAVRDALTVTWDGRLDNRDDLIARYGRGLREATDAALAAIALDRDGTNALRHFIGDWSLAAWNHATRTLWLARDYVGNRPLFFGCRDQTCAWSTSLEALVSLFECGDEVDDGYMAQLLTYGSLPFTTPYRHIQRVPSASVVTITESLDVSCSAYWELPVDSIRRANKDDYADELRGLLTQSVKDRLRASEPVWSHLSGGYDSTTVTCLAHGLVQARAVEAPGLRALSRVFSDSPESSETPYIEAVERWLDIRATMVDRSEAADLSAFNRGPWVLNTDSADSPEWALMRSTNSSIVLSGEMGDLVMAKNSLHSVALLEYLFSGQLRRFVSDAFIWATRRRVPITTIAADLLRAIVRPDERYRRLATQGQPKKRSPRDASAVPHGPDSLLDAQFVQRHAPRQHTIPVPRDRYPLSKQHLARGITWWMQNGVLTSPDSTPDVRMTFPFADRRLVSYVLAIPESVLWDARRTRALMRTALTDVLPPEVLNRQSKGYAPTALRRRFRDMSSQLPADPANWQVVLRGYAEPHSIRAALRGLHNDTLDDEGPLLTLMSVETWFHGRSRWVNGRVEQTLVS